MRFRLGELDYRVRWEFSQHKRRQTTTAILEVKEPRMSGVSWLETTRGESHCNPLDKFDRVLGQRKALADALGPWEEADRRHGNEMSPEQRAIVWAEFERIRAVADMAAVQSLRENMDKRLADALLKAAKEAAPGIAVDIETAPGAPWAAVEPLGGPESPQRIAAAEGNMGFLGGGPKEGKVEDDDIPF
jgi:hypothetical protein